MSDQEILDLPMGMIAAKNTYLLMWVTNSHLALGLQCLEAWGFQYKGIHTWVKTSNSGGVRLGVGHYGRNCTEHFLVALRGNPGTFTSMGLTNIPNVIHATRSIHSRKPDEFWVTADRLKEAMGCEAIELFAREKRPGWDAWGLEVGD